MSARQRKVERQRAKRRKRRREQKILALRGERRLKSDAHPVQACLVNRFWREDGEASIFLTRDLGERRVTLACFLVDLWAMGLKDAWGRTDIPMSEFDEMVSRFKEKIEWAPLHPGTAKHLVYGGIRLARELGFRLPRRYERWTAILGPLPEGESPDMGLFLPNGKIRLMCSRRDLEARLISTTPEKFLSRPDVEFVARPDDFTLIDEEDEAAADVLEELERTMLEHARRWCFAHGQTPHPLLPEVVGAALEAVLQGLPPDFDLDEEVESLSEEQQEEIAERTLSFLSASLARDPSGLTAAMDQFFSFMHSMDSPGGLLKIVDLDE